MIFGTPVPRITKIREKVSSPVLRHERTDEQKNWRTDRRKKWSPLKVYFPYFETNA